mgnify:CR=1 FL=1
MQENTALFEFDAQIAAQGYPLVCGVDEAGRGPLAGPVVAAAVILPPQEQLLERWPQLAQLNDSKKLSEKKREQLFEPICQAAVAYGIGQADCGEIDRLNILNATFLAMSRAVQQLEENFSLHPDILLVDGNRDPKIMQPTQTVIKGDANSAAIAAASVLAKVTRDRMMVYYDSIYPEYGFASNKGYGSAEHIAALKKYGPTPIHRRTFIKNFVS